MVSRTDTWYCEYPKSFNHTPFNRPDRYVVSVVLGESAGSVDGVQAGRGYLVELTEVSSAVDGVERYRGIVCAEVAASVDVVRKQVRRVLTEVAASIDVIAFPDPVPVDEFGHARFGGVDMYGRRVFGRLSEVARWEGAGKTVTVVLTELASSVDSVSTSKYYPPVWLAAKDKRFDIKATIKNVLIRVLEVLLYERHV